MRLGERAWAQLTSPGAAKWYRAACPSRQTLEIHLEPGATLEWLPQESIVFAGAQAELETRIQLRGDARLFYWDMVALGRPASGERFASGHFVAALDIRRDDRLLWHERQRIDGGDRLLDSPIGLAGTRCWRPWSPAARSTPTCCNAAARSPAPAAATSASCPEAFWWRAAGRRGAARASLADRTLAPAAAGAARPRGRSPTHLEYLRWTCPPARKTSC
uniref:Urease accessory protein UreD n=1 Tax=Pseudomonas aeruginosa TaxID=287 RepID=A0A5E5R1J8_PSEAI|nr:Urease accessory protein UreD [Pseudomonas aeruginosa]